MNRTATLERVIEEVHRHSIEAFYFRLVCSNGLIANFMEVPMKRIGVVGARKYEDRQSVIDLILSLPKDSIVITSSCRGVCTWAGEASRAVGLEVRIFAPDLTGIENRADMVERYYRRNRELISACEMVHAFISQEEGLTGGTR